MKEKRPSSAKSIAVSIQPEPFSYDQYRDSFNPPTTNSHQNSMPHPPPPLSVSIQSESTLGDYRARSVKTGNFIFLKRLIYKLLAATGNDYDERISDLENISRQTIQQLVDMKAIICRLEEKIDNNSTNVSIV